MDYTNNKKAFFNYKIEEKITAGIELRGFEVKSIRKGSANLAGSYVKIYDNEAWLVNCSIPPFQEKNTPLPYDKERSRKLLLKKDEIKRLLGKLQEKGLTLVPIKLYNIRGKIKIELGLGKAKKDKDKRETIKKRDIQKSMRRGLE